ncbi:MAG TPA: hypothetical protein VEC11_16890 [Allosphingosinicella sp.]|nr:hypothetical protein [Allosphingosinicella sp.]
MRGALRFLLLAAMLLAPVGRIGIAQAMAMPANAPAAMAGHCADMPAAAPAGHGGAHKQAPQQDDERKAVDCMIACAAMTTAPAPFVAPAPLAEAMPGALQLSSLSGIRPEADPPPPRFS